MQKFKHKKTGEIGIIKQEFLYLENKSKYKNIVIPKAFILDSTAWIEIKDVKKHSCYSEIRSIRRKEDSVTFSIGDTVRINDDKALVNLTISKFVNQIHRDICFTCIETKEKNGYGDNLINIDVIKHIKNTGIMTKQCLSIQDYIDVLRENKKAFLFENTMIKYLKEKIK